MLLHPISAPITEEATSANFNNFILILIKNLPNSFTAEQKQEITAQYRDLIMKQLVPAYQSMHTFLINDYIPSSRVSVGYSDFTNGKAWYEYQIKKNTTLNLSADEIHNIGLSEVSRILSEMKMMTRCRFMNRECFE